MGITVYSFLFVFFLAVNLEVNLYEKKGLVERSNIGQVFLYKEKKRGSGRNKFEKRNEKNGI